MKKMVENLKSEDKNPREDERHKLEKFIKQKEQQNNILKKMLKNLKPSVKKTTK